jgi:hypothetical protein
MFPVVSKVFLADTAWPGRMSELAKDACAKHQSSHDLQTWTTSEARLTPESDFGCEFAGMTSIGRCTYLLYGDAIVGICTSPSC